MTYGDDEAGRQLEGYDRDERDERDDGDAAWSVGALPAGDCWPTEGSWPAGPSYWLPRPRASGERGGDRRPAAEPEPADAFLPGANYWPAGEDYWTGPALRGRGRGAAGMIADQAAGLAAERDEPVYPVYDYEDGQP
jgi:hypothetical protein